MSICGGFPEFQNLFVSQCLPVQCTEGNADFNGKNSTFLSKLAQFIHSIPNIVWKSSKCYPSQTISHEKFGCGSSCVGYWQRKHFNLFTLLCKIPNMSEMKPQGVNSLIVTHHHVFVFNTALSLYCWDISEPCEVWPPK